MFKLKHCTFNKYLFQRHVQDSNTHFVSGKGGELVDSGNNTYGGKYVINPSGGLISKGHPLGATGTVVYNDTTFEEITKD